ncbi:hypothetical protein V7S43_000773 [Phytophthora oleae]|uniref:RxLR effector protein n=1 Tax=Phytophthora oleae TaxID=2107226 RepID=A0ABD3G6P9_9STRA
MQLGYVAVIAAAILVTWVNATPTTSGYEQTTDAFTEQSQLLRSEGDIGAGKRLLRIHNAKEGTTGENEEERGVWETAKTRVNLKKWFLKKRVPEYVRQKLQVPPSGGAMFAHANYKYYMEYLERYNNYYRIMKYNS